MSAPASLNAYSGTASPTALNTPRLFHCGDCQIYIRVDIPNYIIFCPRCQVLMAQIAYQAHDFQPLHGTFNEVFLLYAPSAVTIPKVVISRQDVERESECAVCLEEFRLGETASQLPCSHKFHVSCIHPWLKSYATCPLCRRNVFETKGLIEEGGR